MTSDEARPDTVALFVNCTWQGGPMGPGGAAEGDYVGGGTGIEDSEDAIRYSVGGAEGV